METSSHPLLQQHRLVPITHNSSDGDRSHEVVVTHVSLLVTFFSRSCVWVHITNAYVPKHQSDQRRADVKSLPPVGCASVATPLPFPPFVSESLVLESPTVQPVLQQDGEVVGATAVAPQTTFARGLAARLARRFRSHNEEANPKGIVFTVCCGVSGDLEAMLLGTLSGGVCTTVLEFGGIVYREVLSLVDNVLGSGALVDGNQLV